MSHPEKILVVDENPDNGVLLVGSIARRFPKSAVQLCRDEALAEKVLSNESIGAVVLHRAHDAETLTTIQKFRRISPDVPLLVVSSVDRSDLFFKAGADEFLNYDEWLRVGTVLLNLIKSKREAKA